MENPFQFGRELGDDELVDREDEVRAVVRVMLAAGKLFLIGPRRYGKTSILRAATDAVRRRRGIVLRYDAEAFPSLEELATRLMGDSATRLARTTEKAGAVLSKFFQSVRPEGVLNVVDGTLTVSVGATGPRATGLPLLADILDGVERAAARVGRPVAVVIDEFQKVVEDGGTSAEGQIRAAIQRHRHVAYVFAGSKTRLLGDMTGDPGRPFYKLGEVCFLGPIPRQAFAGFLDDGFRAAGIPVAESAVEVILDAAEDVPYNVQALAHACWEACRGGGSAGGARSGRRDRTAETLTPAVVRRTRDVVALRNDPLYTQLWSSLPPSQQKALVALLREGAEGLLSTAVSRQYGLPVPTMQKALAALDAKGIVREEQLMGKVRLRLEDPFFGAWVGLVVGR